MEIIANFGYHMWGFFSPKHLAFQSIVYERAWCRLFQKRAVYTKLAMPKSQPDKHIIIT